MADENKLKLEDITFEDFISEGITTEEPSTKEESVVDKKEEIVEEAEIAELEEDIEEKEEEIVTPKLKKLL